jgi:hypothetical protein
MTASERIRAARETAERIHDPELRAAYLRGAEKEWIRSEMAGLSIGPSSCHASGNRKETTMTETHAEWVTREAQRLYPLDLSARIEWMTSRADNEASAEDRRAIMDAIYRLRNGVTVNDPGYEPPGPLWNSRKW